MVVTTECALQRHNSAIRAPRPTQKCRQRFIPGQRIDESAEYMRPASDVFTAHKLLVRDRTTAIKSA
jgi:hypothetical protein